MIKPMLLLAAAAAALAASPLAARPMTATDMQSMHRLGAPSVSPDGRYAVFTLSTTDWAKNKRVNTLYMLDLTRPGAAPQPVAGAEKGHDAVFGADGVALVPDAGRASRTSCSAWPSAARRCRSAASRATSAGSSSRRPATASSSGPTATCAAPTSTAPACRAKPKTGSGRTYDQLFIRHWDTWAEPGVRSRACSPSRSPAASWPAPACR